MPLTTHKGVFLANEDGTATEYAKNSGGGGGGDNSVVAYYEESPATAAHAVDTYIHYNGVTYVVTDAIAIGDTLSVGTNIEVAALPEGTVIYIPDEDGSLVAAGVSYDNTTSGLAATNVQAAIDEVVSEKIDKVASPVPGNLAGLNSSGEVIDSGYSPLGFATTAHTQAASTITAGTLAGKVVANATAVATLGDSQVRNIYFGTTDLTPGVSALPTGDIYIVYEP